MYVLCVCVYCQAHIGGLDGRDSSITLAQQGNGTFDLTNGTSIRGEETGIREDIELKYIPTPILYIIERI